jgi:hypothetical protein
VVDRRANVRAAVQRAEWVLEKPDRGINHVWIDVDNQPGVVFGENQRWYNESPVVGRRWCHRNPAAHAGPGMRKAVDIIDAALQRCKVRMDRPYQPSKALRRVGAIPRGKRTRTRC